MTHLDLAALFILIAIPLLAVAALWQLYIMLSETHTLNRYQKQPAPNAVDCHHAVFHIQP